jgi:hypothetical protein
MEAVIFASGTNGPTSNRWGDYCSSRKHDRYALTWVGAGYIQNGGSAASNHEPRYVWFGRQVFAPPANHQIWVNKFSSTWQNGSISNPYRTINAGHFATVAGDEVLIRAGTYNEQVRFDRPCTVKSYSGGVFIRP